MTDIAVEKWNFAPPDRAWLLTELTGNGGSVPTTHGTIDFSLFDADTQYPDGYIPSGTVVGVVTDGGAFGPYDAAALDGRQTAAGFLYNATRVPSDNRKVTVAVVDCFAVVSTSRLPESSGYDDAAAAALPLVKFRA